MELEKYFKNAKDIINNAYFKIQDALMKHDESIDKLKSNGWQYSEEKYSKLHQEIVSTYDTESQLAVSECKAALQEQKNAYMKEVSDYYTPNGSKIDLNDMNLIKAGFTMTADEFVGMIRKHIDNPTMLRIVEKYAAESKMIEKIRETSYECSVALMKVKKAGKAEEKIFDSFIHLATMGMNHPDKTFTLYQARLDDYEEDAILKLLKAKLYVDDETQQRIREIEQKQRDKQNVKTKGKDYGWGILY